MELIVVTRNGKTFLNYTPEKYAKNKALLDKDGYRKATKAEIDAHAKKQGLKSVVVEKPKAKKTEPIEPPIPPATQTQ